MITVKNLTNSPHELITKDGKIMVPAFGEATGDFDPEYIDLMIKCGSFILADAPKKRGRPKKEEDTVEED